MEEDKHKQELYKQVQAYLIELRFLRKLSEKSIQAYQSDILQCIDWLLSKNQNVYHCSYKTLRTYLRVLLDEKQSVATINRKMVALKGFFVMLERDGHVQSNPVVFLSALKKQKKLPSVMSMDQIQDILGMKAQNFLELRDLTLYHFMYSTGCRISEALSIDVSLFLKAREATASSLAEHLPESLRIRGKGSKERYVFVTKKCQAQLAEYLPKRALYLQERRVQSEALFVNQHGKRLTRVGASGRLAQHLKKLGLGECHAHTFRHSYATHLLDKGLNIRLLQSMLGHSSINSTQVYTHVSRRQVIEQYKMSHPRGKKQTSI